MVKLLRNCIHRDDGDSWAELRLVFDRVTAAPLRRLVLAFGFAATDADDAVMEVWLRLLQDDLRKLRTFRGSTLRQLETWFVRVSVNCTLQWLDKRQRKSKAVPETAVPELETIDNRGPEPDEIDFILRELEFVAVRGDIAKLRVLAGFESPPASTGRTLRN